MPNTVLVAASGLALAVLSAQSAKAHAWYEYECCSEQDCRKAAIDEVTVTPDGYFVSTTGETIARNDGRLRFGEDWDWHICLVPSETKVRCLYRPGGGL